MFDHDTQYIFWPRLHNHPLLTTEAIEPLLPTLQGQQASRTQYPHRISLSVRPRHSSYDNAFYHLSLLR